ncbi:RNA-directed DNA polymerase, eukaryota, Reverse transcriptase zinc-binding domain protein [Artemisia annua]|uniref:RNA-directed DNA polymerase, eukaryota, Reverse transcriptase zinc-binding domain protein n=1 Tax=Artemisia annua TaxID=35608 RepID=A0A2U1M9S3_ARTAN|nr:RNA-directed DNA polymerase, eukaryota, Reverse transcriptase zinc-binding domain protein [Artemisia annua]
MHKECKFKDRWMVDSGAWHSCWNWKVPPRGRSLDDVCSLTSLLCSMSVSCDTLDCWQWGLHSSRKFSVQSLSTIIHDRILDSSILSRKFPWNSWIPKKVNICLWRASLDRLPSKPNLYTRGIPVSSTLCPLCYSEIKLLDHCLVNCPLVKSVWAKVGSWWGVDLSGFSLDDFIYGSRISFVNKWAAKAFRGVAWSLVWYIWKWRNEVVHASPSDVPSILRKDLFPHLQRISRVWVSNRCSNIGVDWCMWMSSPNLCFSSLWNR